MARTRLDKTLADYVVIAISPALIMALVGSLVFFLLTVGYQGQFESRMHWILFWFVFGAVLVARIAIEEGRERARVFGVILCGAVGLGVTRFIDAIIMAWVLLAIVWWCASKLTWDCTLIDEAEDASGEGLLQSAGFDPAAHPDAADSEQLDDAVPENALAANSGSGKSRPHAPGLWVVYFSLAALPLFGVGQLLIPAQDAARRSYAFQLLAIYVASAIALLLTTSFLGLRRYLRQRKLEMPAAMTRMWLGVGAGLLIAILLLALIIPRPQGEYTLTALINNIDAKLKQASKFAVLKNDRGEGEGRRIGDQDPKAKQPGEGQPPEKGQPGRPAEGKDPQGNPGERGEQGQDKPGDQSGGTKDGKNNDAANKPPDPQANNPDQKPDPAAQQQPGGKQQDNQARQPDPAKKQPPQNQAQKAQQDNKPSPANSATSSSTNWLAWLAPLVKWIVYGLLVIIGIYLLLKHWSQVVDFLAKLWAEFLSLFGFARTATPGTDEGDGTPFARDVLPFASYVNPFTNGTAGRMSPSQLVRYTFEALEAWARERVVERPADQTPLEFAEEIGRRVPAMAQEVTQTTRLYMHIAYSRNTPSRDRLDILERMWRRFEA